MSPLLVIVATAAPSVEVILVEVNSPLEFCSKGGSYCQLLTKLLALKVP